MTKRADSQRVKAAKLRQANDTWMQAAIKDLLAKKEKLVPGKSCQAIAKEHGVDHIMLSRLVKPENRSISDFNASKQKLTPSKERVMVEWICQSADRGFPQTYDQARKDLYSHVEA
ncbi:hypothetical protein EWM64_g9079 [Hericium alpestre]|uniref:HTH CENPB-type domain-containing protein n=1 Tax=Hericium alpestre TaxID=135208 RepID=A0A4Y9ZM71_9AGAM|nr:hypothetical protein EWM64_g9079 [Hericium alpestre]